MVNVDSYLRIYRWLPVQGFRSKDTREGGGERGVIALHLSWG